jgi:hypothetical protein
MASGHGINESTDDIHESSIIITIIIEFGIEFGIALGFDPGHLNPRAITYGDIPSWISAKYLSRGENG